MQCSEDSIKLYCTARFVCHLVGLLTELFQVVLVGLCIATLADKSAILHLILRPDAKCENRLGNDPDGMIL